MEHNIHDESKIEVLNKRQNERQYYASVSVFVYLCGWDFSCACVRIHINRIKKYCNCTQAAATTTITIANAADACAAVIIRIKWQCKCQQQKQCCFTVNELCACVRACAYEMCVQYFICAEIREKNYYIRYDIRKNHDNIVGISYFNDVECTSAQHRRHQ